MPVSTGFLTGIVKNAVSGNPLSNVKIITNGNAPAVYTGSQGEYLLGDLAGTYTMTATKSGYNKKQLQITLESGITKTKNFSMTPI